jgi:hypothetical protein
MKSTYGAAAEKDESISTAHVTEEGGAVTLSSTFSISDPDNLSLAGASVAVTGGTFAGDRDLLAASTGGTAISASYNSASETLTLSGSDTLAHYQQVLDTVTFTAGENPTNFGSNPTRTLTWAISDGAASNNLAALTTTVTVTNVNDPPTLGNVATTASFIEEGAAVTLSGSASVSDPDSLTLAGATVSITGGTFAGDRDVLSATAVGNVTVSYNSTTETLTLSGSDTLAHYSQVLDSVTFQSTAFDPTKGGADPTRTVSWVLSDGSASNNLSTPVTTTISMQPAPNGTWAHIDGGTPVAMAGGDFEGLGSAQLIASEVGVGTWIYMPSGGFWSKIDNGVPTIMAEGNLYGTSRGNNNQADLVAYNPGVGTSTWQNGFGWTQIDSSTAVALTTGVFQGGGVTEIAGSFTGVGVRLWAANTGWSSIDSATPTLLASGNFYGTTNGNNNNSDLVAFYPGGGTWIWAASTGWSRLDSSTPGSPSEFAAGNFLGTANGNNNRTDLAAFFPSLGTYIWSQATGWNKIDSSMATGLTAVDLNGDGQSELLGYFPNAGGMWEFQFGLGWSREDPTHALPITSQTPEFATGNFLGGNALLGAVGFQNTQGVWLDPTTPPDTASTTGGAAIAGATVPNVALLGQAMAAFAPPNAPDNTPFTPPDPSQTASLAPPHHPPSG